MAVFSCLQSSYKVLVNPNRPNGRFFCACIKLISFKNNKV
nr:MAG TPA: hypothetical protein [Caudoviricetes sp.]